MALKKTDKNCGRLELLDSIVCIQNAIVRSHSMIILHRRLNDAMMYDSFLT